MLLEEAIRGALLRDPAQPAIEFEGQWYDWGWLNAVAAKVDHLLTSAGFGANTPVGLVARNRPNFVAALLSTIAASRSAVMIYAFQSKEALAADIRRLKLPVVIADAQDWTEPVREAALETGMFGIALGGVARDDVTTVVIRDGAKAGEVRGPVDELAIEMLTSGTTGTPKRLPLAYNFVARALIGESTQAAKPAAPGTLDPALMMFPFGNISGLYSYIPMAASGRPVVLLEKFTAKDWIGFVQRYCPKQMNLPPAGVRMVLDAAPSPEDLSSLDFVFSGASWLDPNVQEEFRRVFNVPILLSYGATEFGGPVTAMTPDLYKEYGASKLTSVGRAWAGTELRVIDQDTGKILPKGQTGVLELRAPRLGPEWVRTTDLAMIDEDEFIFHCGRADGVISRGGYKILPEMVAEKLALHPSVAAAAVVGLPDARLGEVPVAAVELRPGTARPTLAELEAHARRHLYATHIPVAFLIVESLPRTPSLKISLPAVRALFDGLGRADAPAPEGGPAVAVNAR
jgi:long-chain acyl-CoA synthetase